MQRGSHTTWKARNKASILESFISLGNFPVMSEGMEQGAQGKAFGEHSANAAGSPKIFGNTILSNGRRQEEDTKSTSEEVISRTRRLCTVGAGNSTSFVISTRAPRHACSHARICKGINAAHLLLFEFNGHGISSGEWRGTMKFTTAGFPDRC